jgi:hypothetical protein
MRRFQIIPRSNNFYEQFDRSASNLAETSALQNKVLTDFHDHDAANA